MNKLILTLILTVGFGVFGWGQQKSIRILFVGNSLTYTNKLPELVEIEAANMSVSIKTEILASANYALEDHWNDGELQRLIKTEKFDFVVVQQGPSSQHDGREMLLNFGKRIKALCDKHHSRLVFFMVWPAIANIHTFDGVVQNYTDAASETNSILCPVGKRWKEYIEKTGDYSYYGPDGFHPSLNGSKEAARLITAVIVAEQ